MGGVQSDFLAELAVELTPVFITLSAHASRRGGIKISRSVVAKQTDFLAQLFPADRPERQQRQHKARTVTSFRASPGLLARYRGLSDIAPDEWFEFFGKTDQVWSKEDQDYLIEWWGRDDVMSLSYALERPPWNLQREVCKLRKQGVRIAYQREG